ncbi:hypothetical protein HUT19_20745 [Streptomyces sp. NA02950]|uniref:hypothetical protein n=1 Tax=Streptomyces sp. NA02950 TaxID=2742137 RepID=UPI0015905BFC|nr:hypothetical protein [Streptomyces sp. NA02950]QKV93889.1 hypothetical protein HUT19_20745 [Streptomyces sp. NA02950]
MRTFIGDQEAVSASEFEELALGFETSPIGLDHELFVGPPHPESVKDRQARRAVAREVLRELHEAAAGGDEVAAWDALYAKNLTRTIPLTQPTAHGHRAALRRAAA